MTTASPRDSTPAPADPPGVQTINGRTFMEGPGGTLVPAAQVKAEHKLEDELVRRLMAAAEQLHDVMVEFKAKVFDDIDAYAELLAEKYGASVGGEKGNITLQTYDRLQKVQVAIQDRLAFGPELQVAKRLIDECLMEWSADARPELGAIVANAFRTNKEGRVNRGALLGLLRLEITDERWTRAIQAIRDSITVEGSARYVRFHRRRKSVDRFDMLSLDLATV